MRYTEARLARIAEAMMADIDKETVDWNENFDGSLQEPAVLPALLPNLLLNGASGIAVGMATNIPPHNLGEVVDAIVHLLDHWTEVDDITVEELMQFIQGPDFPTGGLVLGRRDSICLWHGQRQDHDASSRHRRNERRTPDLFRTIPTQQEQHPRAHAELVRAVVSAISRPATNPIAPVCIVIELKRPPSPRKTLEPAFQIHATAKHIRGEPVNIGEPRLLSLKRAATLH
jgi:DNA gyrase subunit A